MDRMDEDNLEYNDGLGDMLRQKDRLEFSWIKTIVSLFIIFLVVFGILYALFTFGKKAMSGPEVKYTATPTEQTPEEILFPEEDVPSENADPEFDDLVTLDPQSKTSSESQPAPAPKPIKIAPAPAPKPSPVVTKPVIKPAAPTPKPVKIAPAPAPKPSESRIKSTTPLKSKEAPIEKTNPRSQATNAHPVSIQPVSVRESQSSAQPKRIHVQHTIAPKATPSPEPSSFVGPEPISDLPAPTSFKVIVGSFQNRPYAADLVSKLQNAGISATLFQDSAGNFKVQSGSFKTREEAKSHQARLSKKGFSDTFLLMR